MNVSYLHDTEIGCWFADLRDADGNLISSGNGDTEALALAHLVEKVGAL